MTADITVDLGSAIPPYEQIRTQVASFITIGTLSAGSRLSTVRRLAADLGIAAGTVARAYKELEQAGLITTGRRNGTVVAGNPRVPTQADVSGTPVAGTEVVDAVDRFIAAARYAGLDDGALLALVRARLGAPGQ